MKKFLIVAAVLLAPMTQPQDAHAGKTFDEATCNSYKTFAKCNDIMLRHADSCTWDTAASKCVAAVSAHAPPSSDSPPCKDGKGCK